jgi:hypothetical protein
MPGDGVFMWYWGAGEAPEKWSRGFASVKDAAKHAHGHQPNGDYTLMEADRLAINPAVFAGSEVLCLVQMANPSCWPQGIPVANARELIDLEAKLADCLDRWLRKHNYDSTTAIHAIRNREYHPDRRGAAHG